MLNRSCSVIAIFHWHLGEGNVRTLMLELKRQQQTDSSYGMKVLGRSNDSRLTHTHQEPDQDPQLAAGRELRHHLAPERNPGRGPSGRAAALPRDHAHHRRVSTERQPAIWKIWLTTCKEFHQQLSGSSGASSLNHRRHRLPDEDAGQVLPLSINTI